MDGITSEVSMPASAETASPSEAAPSTSVQPEATTATDVANLAPTESPVAESDPATPELPDEQTFEQLSGPERGQNWKQARARIAELNQQVQQFSTHQPVIEQIEQAGGWDRFQQQAELGSLLFSQVEGADGQINLTAEPLIERLASESPSTLGEIVWKGIHQPSPWYANETILDGVIRDQLGLDPSLIEIYRQIQNPADAQKFMQPGQITAEELSAVPEQFRDAYKSLTPKQREELAYADEETKQAFLQDKADALQARQFIAEQNRQKELAQQQYAQQFQQRVEARGEEIANSVRDTALNAAKEKLKATANFSADEAVNETIHGEAIQWAVQQVLADAALAADNERATKLYNLAADAELRGDKIRADQYRLQGDALGKKLEGRFLNKLTERTAFWSKAFGGVRQTQQQQVEQARPRPEIGSNNQPLRQNTPTKTVGQGFEVTPQKLAQYQQIFKQSQMQNG